MKDLVSAERIERMIILIRGKKVMFDSDLAELYVVETKVLMQAVKRNIDRFPEDFMFQLTKKEFDNLRFHSGTSRQDLRSQIVTSSWGGRRYPPYAFTEQGVAMLSSVLRSERAVKVNIEIMRAFVRMRKMLISHEKLARKIEELEKRYDAKFKIVFDALRQIMTPSKGDRNRIGFVRRKEKT